MKIIKLSESITDPTQKALDPTVWDIEEDQYTLKPELKQYIIKRIGNYIIGQGQDLSIVTHLWLVGSITGYNYAKESDMDINVGVSLDQIGIDKLKENLGDINNVTAPNTTHAVNYYFSTEGAPITSGDFIWDILGDKWIKETKQIKIDVDYSSVMTLIDSDARAIDMDEGAIKRDLVEYFMIKEDLKDISSLEIKEETLKELLVKKEFEIFTDLDNLKKRYVELHEYRDKGFKQAVDDLQKEKQRYLTPIRTNVKDPNYTINNIVYKYLEKYKYIQRLEKYLLIHKDLLKHRDLKQVEADFKKILEITKE